MTTTVEYADDAKIAEFESKLNDENLMPITHRITIEAVDFVNMSEFNDMQIKASEFDEKKKEYISEHSKLSTVKLMAHEMRTKLSDAGLYVEKVALGAKPFGLENSLQAICEKLKSDMAKSTTPPQRTIIAIPKQVSSYNLLSCL